MSPLGCAPGRRRGTKKGSDGTAGRCDANVEGAQTGLHTRTRIIMEAVHAMVDGGLRAPRGGEPARCRMFMLCWLDETHCQRNPSWPVQAHFLLNPHRRAERLSRSLLCLPCSALLGLLSSLLSLGHLGLPLAW
ncbi:hypothetical protein IQ07DRAFT_219377 [Pyrenochaeta sp. DS3sAY3a]|nr:hypothetical protein IQ07DRAFT_219377 [Pyrenochaeta sp. DS3sAY3a]